MKKQQKGKDLKLPTTNKNQTITFTLSAKPFPKQRARVTKNGSFHIQTYYDWMKKVVKALSFEKIEKGIETIEKIKKVEIFFYSNNQRPDLDNCAGAVLDALQKASVIKNDNIKCIKWIETKFFLIKKEESPIISINLITEAGFIS